MSNAESMYVMIGKIPSIETEIIDMIIETIVEPPNDQWEIFKQSLQRRVIVTETIKGAYMDEMLTKAVNTRVSCLRKSYRKARRKNRYKRWYKSCSKEELHQIINFIKRR